MEQIPLANTFKVIAFPTVQSLLHCFNAICLIFWENEGSNVHTMSRWTLNEKNICKRTHWAFGTCFPRFLSFPLKVETANLIGQKKNFGTTMNIYIFSLPFHCKIITEQISYKHLGMKWWTKPTRVRCHGDYIWGTLKTFSFILLSL